MSIIKIVSPMYTILDTVDGQMVLRHIESIGRTCYKSEDKITDTSATNFVRTLVSRGHEAMIEHFSVSVKFICDRGVSHELVRHRMASWAQESTRYCNYGKQNEITVIKPYFFDAGTPAYTEWETACKAAEAAYLSLLNYGVSPQEARSVLPHSLKTEVIMTANLREWRHFFKLRTDIASHPQMREIARPLLDEFKRLIPVVFEDINYESGN